MPSPRPPVEVIAYPLPQGGELACVRHRLLPATNPQRRWQHWAAALVVTGSGSYHDHQGRRHALAPGSLLQHLPGHHHRLQRSDPQAWVEYAIRADASTSAHLQALGILDPRPVARAPSGLAAARRAFDRCAGTLAHPHTSPSAALHAVHTLLLAWFPPHQAPPAASDPDPAIAAIAQRLAADTTAALPLAQAAAAVGLSEPQFRRRFRARYGTSPGHWRDRHRLATAARLLAENGLAVTAVAEACGYADPAVFSRAFKRCYGHPPAAHAAMPQGDPAPSHA